MGPLGPQVTPRVSQDQINDRARAGGVPVAAAPACLANVTRSVMTTRGRQMQGPWTELDWAVDLNPGALSHLSHQPPDEGVFWGLLCAMARCHVTSSVPSTQDARRATFPMVLLLPVDLKTPLAAQPVCLSSVPPVCSSALCWSFC